VKTLTVQHPKQKVFDAIKKASSRLELDIESSDIAKGKLKLYHSGGLLSFGNEVIVKVSSKNSKSVIRVSSTSAASIQLIDWGANKTLEKDLIDEVKDILGR
jgi:hypothetical protein